MTPFKVLLFSCAFLGLIFPPSPASGTLVENVLRDLARSIISKPEDLPHTLGVLSRFIRLTVNGKKISAQNLYYFQQVGPPLAEFTYAFTEGNIDIRGILADVKNADEAELRNRFDQVLAVGLHNFTTYAVKKLLDPNFLRRISGYSIDIAQILIKFVSNDTINGVRLSLEFVSSVMVEQDRAHLFNSLGHVIPSLINSYVEPWLMRDVNAVYMRSYFESFKNGMSSITFPKPLSYWIPNNYTFWTLNDTRNATMQYLLEAVDSLRSDSAELTLYKLFTSILRVTLAAMSHGNNLTLKTLNVSNVVSKLTDTEVRFVLQIANNIPFILPYLTDALYPSFIEKIQNRINNITMQWKISLNITNLMKPASIAIVSSQVYDNLNSSLILKSVRILASSVCVSLSAFYDDQLNQFPAVESAVNELVKPVDDIVAKVAPDLIAKLRNLGIEASLIRNILFRSNEDLNALIKMAIVFPIYSMVAGRRTDPGKFLGNLRKYGPKAAHLMFVLTNGKFDFSKHLKDIDKLNDTELAKKLDPLLTQYFEDPKPDSSIFAQAISSLIDPFLNNHIVWGGIRSVLYLANDIFFIPNVTTGDYVLPVIYVVPSALIRNTSTTLRTSALYIERTNEHIKFLIDLVGHLLHYFKQPIGELFVSSVKNNTQTLQYLRNYGMVAVSFSSNFGINNLRHGLSLNSIKTVSEFTDTDLIAFYNDTVVKTIEGIGEFLYSSTIIYDVPTIPFRYLVSLLYVSLGASADVLDNQLVAAITKTRMFISNITSADFGKGVNLFVSIAGDTLKVLGVQYNNDLTKVSALQNRLVSGMKLIESASSVNTSVPIFQVIKQVGEAVTEIVQTVLNSSSADLLENLLKTNALQKLKELAATFGIDPSLIDTVITQIVSGGSKGSGKPKPDSVIQSAISTWLKRTVNQVLSTSVYYNASYSCLTDLDAFAKALPDRKQWAIQMLDAYGKPGAGVFMGNIRFNGDFAECKKVDSGIIQKAQVGLASSIKGKWCMANKGGKLLGLDLTFFAGEGAKFGFGLCVPKSCSANDIYALISSAVAVSGTGVVADNIDITRKDIVCDEPSNWRDDSLAITATVVFSILGGIILFCTLYDGIIINCFLVNRNKGVSPTEIKIPIDTKGDKQHEMEMQNVRNGKRVSFITENVKSDKQRFINQLIQAFSVYTHAGKILNFRHTKDSFEALHGIRFLSMAWVVLGHTFSSKISSYYSRNYFPAMDDYMSRFTFQPILNGTFSVDSFFVISGLLATYLFLKMLQKQRKLHPVTMVMYYIHRYVRLTPLLMLTILFTIGLLPYLGSGPMWFPTETLVKQCKKNWWTNLLYVNNFVEPKDLCLGHTWYLAIDMQLYWIAPFILIPLFFYPVYAVVASIFIIAGSIAVTGILIADKLTDAEVAKGPKFMLLTHTFQTIYIKPWCRMGPYFIGVLSGFFLYKRGRDKLPIPKIITFIAWVLFLGIGMTDLFLRITETHEGVLKIFQLLGMGKPTAIWSREFTIAYEALSRAVWSLFVAWVSIACITGDGGIVNKILSWEGWLPLSRLTYAAYLWHPLVQTVSMQLWQTTHFLTDSNIAITYCGELMISYGVGLIASMCLEAPFMALDKLLLGRLMRRK